MNYHELRRAELGLLCKKRKIKYLEEPKHELVRRLELMDSLEANFEEMKGLVENKLVLK